MAERLHAAARCLPWFWRGPQTANFLGCATHAIENVSHERTFLLQSNAFALILPRNIGMTELPV